MKAPKRTWHQDTLRAQKRLRMGEAPRKTQKKPLTKTEKMRRKTQKIREQQREEEAVIAISDDEDFKAESMENKEIKAGCEPGEQRRSWTPGDTWCLQTLHMKKPMPPGDLAGLHEIRCEKLRALTMHEAHRKQVIEKVGGYNAFMALRHQQHQKAINEYNHVRCAWRQ